MTNPIPIANDYHFTESRPPLKHHQRNYYRADRRWNPIATAWVIGVAAFFAWVVL